VTFLCDDLSDRKLTFEIPSYTLKKKLSNEIKIRYSGKSVFSNFLRGSTQFEIEKGREFPQGQFQKGERGTQHKGVEITPTRANFSTTTRLKEQYVSPCEVLGFQSIEPTPVQDFKSQETPDKKKAKRQKPESSEEDCSERRVTTRSTSTVQTDRPEEPKSSKKQRKPRGKTIS